MSPGAPGLLLAVFDYAGAGLMGLGAAGVLARGSRPLLAAGLVSLAGGLPGSAVRDLMIGAPVAFLADPGLIALILIAAGAGLAAQTRRWPTGSLGAIDAAGAAVLGSLGALKAQLWGVSPLAAAAVGLISGAAGLVLRGVLAGESPLTARPQALAAPLAAAALTAALRLIGAGAGVALAVGAGGALFASLVLASSARP